MIDLPRSLETELADARERAMKTPLLVKLLPLFIAVACLGFVIPGAETKLRVTLTLCIGLAVPAILLGAREKQNRMMRALNDAGDDVKLWFRSSDMGLVFFAEEGIFVERLGFFPYGPGDSEPYLVSVSFEEDCHAIMLQTFKTHHKNRENRQVLLLDLPQQVPNNQAMQIAIAANRQIVGVR